ncbi:MAG: putative anti-sigma factor [Acidobacteria bacterium]|nr:putative anti-sigma factor [Acidobacteriota bacterium]
MSCQLTQEFLHAYVDGELDLARSLEVEQHMQNCQVCASAYRNQTALRSAFKDSSLYYSAPEKLEKRIRSSLRREAKSEAGRRWFDWRWFPVGVMALILVLGLVIWRTAPSLRPSGDEFIAQEMVSNHVRSLQLESHRTDVISSDQHTVKPWFDGKLDFAPPVKDFSGQGFPLLGGRLEYLNNRAVAALIYQRQKHYINLYIWPAEESNATSEVATKRQGYNLLHWTNSGMTYWAISDLNGVELHEFARLVQEAQ